MKRQIWTANARALAVRLFTILGEAEAKVHGTDLSHVHFHEVGAIDSIVDILSVAVCADSLGIENVILPTLSEGQGMIRCQHGLMPIPVPAVAAVAQTYGLSLRYTGVQGELVTPTGAAIAACFRTEEKLPDSYRIVRCGIGAGKREYELPGILRIMEIETAEDTKDTVWKLESDIDDCSGEALAYCLDCLFKAGAREAHYLPVFTKKNRPAYQLQVICTDDLRETLESCSFCETTTIGIRRCRMERTVYMGKYAVRYPLGVSTH
ncbi:MAG: LarC family nickel insertion protein [Lachnospiraceae bacterium]